MVKNIIIALTLIFNSDAMESENSMDEEHPCEKQQTEQLEKDDVHFMIINRTILKFITVGF